MLSEAVEDGKLLANPALRPGRLRRQMRDPNAPKRSSIDPYTRAEGERLVKQRASGSRSGTRSCCVRSAPGYAWASFARCGGAT